MLSSQSVFFSRDSIQLACSFASLARRWSSARTGPAYHAADGSADPRRTLSHRLSPSRRLVQSIDTRVQRHAGRQRSAGRSAHASTRQRAVALHSGARRGLPKSLHSASCIKKVHTHTAAASPRGAQNDPAPGGGAPQEAPRALRRGKAGPPSRGLKPRARPTVSSKHGEAPQRRRGVAVEDEAAGDERLEDLQ